MTKRRSGTYLSTTRVKGLEQFVRAPLSAYELGDIMWPGHKMSKVNGRAIVRELLLGEYIELTQPNQEAQPKDGGDPVRYRATSKAAAIIANPPWLCRYCSTDISKSMKRLWHYPCTACTETHQTCRFCRKQLLRATGDFPYTVKLRGCPGTVQIQAPPPKKPKKKKEEELQQDLALEH